MNRLTLVFLTASVFSAHGFADPTIPSSTPLAKLAPPDYLVLKKDFPIPEGDALLYQNGHLKGATNSFPANSCVLNRPLRHPDPFKKGEPIAVGGSDGWQENDGVQTAYVRFHEIGFQVVCFGSKKHAPTLADLNRHLGNAFTAKRGKAAPDQAKVDGDPAAEKQVPETSTLRGRSEGKDIPLGRGDTK